MCFLCDLAAEDNARHMIMQCPHHIVRRNALHDDICRICSDFGTLEVFNILLEKPIKGLDMGSMHEIWRISCTYVAGMYWETLHRRTGHEVT